MKNEADYKNASIYAMASQSPLFTVGRIKVTLTKVNCARRLLDEDWKRSLTTTDPGLSSAFLITTPPGTTATEADLVESSPPKVSSYRSSLLTALAQNKININVTDVSALTVVVSKSAGHNGPTGGAESESSDGISVIAIVCIAVGSVVVLAIGVMAILWYNKKWTFQK